MKTLCLHFSAYNILPDPPSSHVQENLRVSASCVSPWYPEVPTVDVPFRPAPHDHFLHLAAYTAKLDALSPLTHPEPEVERTSSGSCA